MYISFYVKKERLYELKKFIRTNLKSARFSHNPLNEGEQYNIALDLSVEDCNKLNVLLSEWYDIDQEKDTKKKSLIQKIKDFFLKI
jgi:hypothetical protein